MNFNEIKIKSVWSQSELTSKEASRMSALLWPPHWPSRLAEGLKVISGCMWPLGAELRWVGGGLQAWGGPLWCNGCILCCRGLWDWSVLKEWGVCDRTKQNNNGNKNSLYKTIGLIDERVYWKIYKLRMHNILALADINVLLYHLIKKKYLFFSGSNHFSQATDIQHSYQYFLFCI